VLDDADIDVAASAGAWSAFLHQGQICMTAGRHIVLEAVADQYLERLAERAGKLPVGDPHTERVALGPLISERQVANVDRIVGSTVTAGAELRACGTHDRLFYAPTVLGGVTPFGGTGASGNGARFGSQSSWDEFTQWRWVTIHDQAHGFPF
jgi:benzaldehyde dehydrogenase (NAD)